MFSIHYSMLTIQYSQTEFVRGCGTKVDCENVFINGCDWNWINKSNDAVYDTFTNATVSLPIWRLKFFHICWRNEARDCVYRAGRQTEHLTFFTIPFCSIISFHYILAFSIAAAYSMYLNWNVSINDSKILYLMISLSIRYFASLFYEYNWNVCLFNVKLNDRINELYFTYSAFDAVDRCVVCNLHMIGLLNIFLNFIDARQREIKSQTEKKWKSKQKFEFFICLFPSDGLRWMLGCVCPKG